MGSWHGPQSCAELEQEGQAVMLLTRQWVLGLQLSQERGVILCKVVPFSQRQHLGKTDCPPSPGEKHPSVLKKFWKMKKAFKTISQKYSFYWGHFELHAGQGSVLMPPFGGWSRRLRLCHKLEAALGQACCR